jgi:hypothetical protein
LRNAYFVQEYAPRIVGGYKGFDQRLHCLSLINFHWGSHKSLCLLTFAFLSYNSDVAIGRGRFFLIALLLVLLFFPPAHLYHLRSVPKNAGIPKWLRYMRGIVLTCSGFALIIIGHDVLLSNEPANDGVSLCPTEDS